MNQDLFHFLSSGAKYEVVFPTEQQGAKTLAIIIDQKLYFLSNTGINHVHERDLRIVYNNSNSTFGDFLRKDGHPSIHHYKICL